MSFFIMKTHQCYLRIFFAKIEKYSPFQKKRRNNSRISNVTSA